MRWLLAGSLVACTPSAVAPGMTAEVGTTSNVAASPKLVSFVQPVRYELAEPPLARYGEPMSSSTTTPVGDAVIAATHAVYDEHLARACANLTAIANPDVPVDANALEIAWSSAGIIDAPTKPIVIRTTNAQAVVAAIGAVPPGSHIGIAQAQDLVVAAVTTPVMTAAPFGRGAPTTGDFVIDGRLTRRFDRVQIEVAWDDHSVLTLSPDLSTSRLVAKIACKNRSTLGRVSISGIDHATSTVLARFPIWCGIDPPHELVVDPLLDASGDTDNDKAAHRMFLLLQRDRVAAGLPPLAWDDRAATAALEHAEDLRAGIRAGTPPQFRKVSFTVPKVVSNIVTATTIDDAYAKIMADPTPRAHSMSAEMTAGGIGVVGNAQELYISQLFVSVPVVQDTAALAITFERAIEGAGRSIAGDAELSSIATEIAAALRAGGDQRKLEWILYARTRQIRKYSKFYFSVTTTIDPSNVQPSALVNHPNVDHIGVGVAQGHNPELGDNALWIVSVQAQRVVAN